MDVRNGDVLAMASSPDLRPESFHRSADPTSATGMSMLDDPKLARRKSIARRRKIMRPAPFSKPSSGWPRWKTGLNPNEIYVDQTRTIRLHLYSAARQIKDTAPPGDYDFNRAHRPFSSNSYFITNGLQCRHLQNIVALGEKFHLGERTGIVHAAGNRRHFPDARTDSHSRLARWRHGQHLHRPGRNRRDAAADGRAYSAIANGGKVFWPRLVDASNRRTRRRRSGDEFSRRPCARRTRRQPAQPAASVRDAMLADVEDAEGTGTGGRRARPAHLRQDRHGAGAERTGTTTRSAQYWFASFAPI